MSEHYANDTQRAVAELKKENEELRAQLAKAREEGVKQTCEACYNTGKADGREEGRKEAVPEGWQVVPKEPTDAMIAASLDCCGVTNPNEFGKRKHIGIAYHAMLADAPSPASLNAKEGGE